MITNVRAAMHAHALSLDKIDYERANNEATMRRDIENYERYQSLPLLGKLKTRLYLDDSSFYVPPRENYHWAKEFLGVT